MRWEPGTEQMLTKCLCSKQNCAKPGPQALASLMVLIKMAGLGFIHLLI